MKTTKETESEVEINLPYYAKTIATTFKIFSENHCISVSDIEGHYSINISHAELPFKVDAVPATEEEFNIAYNKINNIINNFKNQ